MITAPDSPPTYVGDDGRQSWLDVTAILAGLMEQVSDWHVEEDAGLGSDHALISWELLANNPNTAIRHKLNWQKVDWSKFRTELRIQMQPFLYCVLDTPAHIDDVVNQLTLMLQQILTDQVPLQRVCSASRDWWSPKIKELRIHMRRAFRRWQCITTFPTREDYLHFWGLLRMEIRNSKRLHWRKWCAAVKAQNPWKLLRVLKSRVPPTVDALQVDSRLVFENPEKAQVLQKVLFTELKPSSLRFPFEVDATWNTTRPPSESMESWVSIKELKRVCFKMRP